MPLGVWHFHYTGELPFYTRWHNLQAVLLTLKRLTLDVYTLSPVTFPLLCLAIFLQRTENILKWFFFNRILFLIETGLAGNEFPVADLVLNVAARAALGVTFVALGYWVRQAECTVSNYMIRHLEGMVFDYKSKADARTLEKNCLSADDDLFGPNVWWAYSNILEGCGRLVAIIVQIYLSAAYFSSRREAALYTLMFLAKPLINSVLRPSFETKSWIAASNNPHYNRMHSLKAIASNLAFKQEIITNGGSDYLARGYHNARRGLGNASVSHPAQQYEKKEGLLALVMAEFFGEFHLLYFLLAAIRVPRKFSLSKMVMLEDSGETISLQCAEMLMNFTAAQKELATVKRVYDLASAQDAVVDGDIDHSTAASPLGMGLVMQNVSFSYDADTQATQEKKTYVLRDVSFSIQPGQLVVIVGANGSGKSTLVKLLTRMYDCTAGSVLVDGRDIKDYKKDSLHNAMTLLPQEAHLYPGMSLAENIGIGDPRLGVEALGNEKLKRIRAAARKGGAAGFIERLEGKYDAVLDPMAPVLWDCKCADSHNCPLCKVYYDLTTKKGLSGGQLQRLAAQVFFTTTVDYPADVPRCRSRTFMRMASGTIKLVVADEPSASLDPEAEKDLFNSLIRERCGKTMIFVTHRFGHLTKHADLIL
ncbi:P-loop containing nucleoside triphosphate hydrolase protein [Mycena amicta]|nr:P-loop containing nucleoside triphosphate hydrolase protein [Mycena amicta]